MVNIQPIESIGANYNAVNIKIDKPKTIIPEGFKADKEDNGIYNAVNLEVTNPSVEIQRKSIYDYPTAKEVVTSDMAGFRPIDIAPIPFYPFGNQTNLISNKTFVAADFNIDTQHGSNNTLEIEGVELPENNSSLEIVSEEEIDIPDNSEDVPEEENIVPEPNITTTENEKKIPNSELSFHGISFKADNNTRKTIEIVPPVELKPEVDVPKIIENLNSSDLDIQARQIAQIVSDTQGDAQKVVPYIVTEIVSSLVNIVQKDTSELTAPNEEQIQNREKIILNEIAKEQAKLEGKKEDEIELPFQLSDEEQASAIKLSTLEQAERNKEYALYTLALLTKTYSDEVERQTGNVVPLTDLPGVSAMVDTLRYNQNTGVKIAAIDSLVYINRDEYKEEISSLLNIVAKDENPYVSRNAQVAVAALNS